MYFDCLVWLHKPNVSKSYSTFNILRSSSIGCVFILSNFQFWFGPEAFVLIWKIFDQWLLRYFTLNILRLTLICGRLHFEHF